MNTHTGNGMRLGPSHTPDLIKWLLSTTAISSVLFAFLEGFFVRAWGYFSPYLFVGISGWGASRWMIWQPFTYLFTEQGPSIGVSFNFLLSLAFQLYILWVLGTDVLMRGGKRIFLWTYLGAGVATGVFLFGAIKLLGSSAVFFGPNQALLALFVMWVLIHQQAVLLLFFIFPVRAQWLLALALGALTLVTLSQGEFLGFFGYAFAALYSYVYGVGLLGYRSPYPSLRPFEHFLHNLFQSNSKLVHLHNEAFIDEMLDKISKGGRSSLSFYERIKLYWLTRRR